MMGSEISVQHNPLRTSVFRLVKRRAERACPRPPAPARRFRSPKFNYIDQRETKENLRSVGRRFPVIRSPPNSPKALQERSSLSQTRERKGRTDENGGGKKQKGIDGQTVGARRRVQTLARSPRRSQTGAFFRFLPHEKAALALTELEGRREGERTAESKGFPLISPPLSREADGRSKSLSAAPPLFNKEGRSGLEELGRLFSN